MEDRTITMEMVRLAFQSFGAGGVQISNAQLYDALGITSEVEMARMRARINSMVSHGEVNRVGSGVYTYNYKHRPREAKTYTVLWRFVRAHKPGWTVKECALLTRISYTQASRYFAWLEEEGYLERAGRDTKKAVLYRATTKAAASPETPYPPLREADPFQKERTAAATITRLMLCEDPYAQKTARTIAEACQVLLARFGGTVTENENREETTC